MLALICETFLNCFKKKKKFIKHFLSYQAKSFDQVKIVSAEISSFLHFMWKNFIVFELEHAALKASAVIFLFRQSISCY